MRWKERKSKEQGSLLGETNAGRNRIEQTRVRGTRPRERERDRTKTKARELHPHAYVCM